MTSSAQGYLRRQYLCVLRRCAWFKALASCAALILSPSGVAAQSIVVDGRTQTQLGVNGAVTNITTQTIRGSNAFNSFSKFNVDPGSTVNLYLPGQTSNLLNLVHGEQSYINGLVNAYQGGRIGGNVFFYNPHGVIVGSGGVLNVGSLTLATPTTAYMDSLISPTGSIGDEALAQALSGQVPLSQTGLVLVRGRINAQNSIDIAAANVNVASGAQVLAGGSAQVAFADLVNIQGAQQVSGVSVAGGVIRILADNDIDVAGQVSADGLGANAAGGSVTVMAGHNAALQAGGKVSADAGKTGDGGFVEFSAHDTVQLKGSGLSATAHGGAAGNILIDPDNLTWTSADDYYSHGSNITISATKKVVLDGVMVSSRDIGATADSRANHQTAASAGNSGDITVTAKEIETKNGSSLLANATNGKTAGKVTITATDDASTPFFGSVDDSVASVSINNSTIKGGDVSITANANDKWVWIPDQNNDSVAGFFADIGNSALDFISSIRVGANVTFSKAHATVNVDGGSSIDASGKLDVTATAKADASMHVYSTVVGFGYGETDAQAKVNIGQATLASTGDMTLKSQADSTLVVQVDTVNSGSFSNAASSASKYANFSFAVGIANQLAETTVASNALISHADKLTLEATGAKEVSVASSGGSFKDGIASAGISVAISDTTFTSSLGGDITANNVAVQATLTDASTEVSGSAGTAGSPDLRESITSAKPVNEIVFEKLSDLMAAAPSTDNRASNNSSSKLGLSAAFVWADNTNNVKAEVASNAHIHTGQLDVIAKAEEEVSFATSAAVDQRELDTQLPGDPNAPSDKKKIAISASADVIQMQHHADALIGDGAVITTTGAVNVLAASNLSPFWSQWTDLIDAFKAMNWTSPSAYYDLGLKLKDVVADPVHATSWAQTAVESDKLALAGAFTYYTLNNKATAHIGSAQINAGPDPVNAAQDVNVLAHASQGILNLVGVPEFDPTSSINNSSSGTAGFGGSYLQFNLSGGSDASIGSGASIKAEDVAVYAHTSFDQVDVAETVGKAGKLAINGAFSMLDTDIHTIAQIGAGGAMQANDVLVKAKDDSLVINAAGGVARSQSVGIGFSVALNLLDSETLAIIGNRVGETATGGTLNASGDLQVMAERSGVLGAFAVAGSGPSSNEEDTGKTGGDGSKTNSADSGEQGKSGVGISGAASVNIINDTTTARIANLTSVHVSGVGASSLGVDWNLDGTVDETVALDQGLADKASNLALDLAGAGALTVATDKSAGLAGAFTWNQLVKDTRAQIADTSLTVVNGGINLDSNNSGDLWSISASGSAGDKVGIAGSVSYSTIDNVTEASLSDSGASADSSIVLNAKDDSDIRSVAGSVSYGGRAGIGAGVAISTLGSDTSASISGTGKTVSGQQGVTAKAVNDNSIISVAAAIGASQQVAVSGAVTINIIGNQTHADVSGATVQGHSGLVSFEAYDTASIFSISGNAAISTGSASVGISASYNEIDNVTEATASSASLSGANVTLLASEEADIQAIAAGGAGSSKVAATGSLGINTINNQTSATTTSTGVNTAGDLNVKATDNSQMLSITGAIGVAGNAAVGASGSYNHIGNIVLAEISGGSQTATNVLVDSERASTMEVWAVAGSGAGTAGFAGSIALNDIGGVTTAQVDSGAQVSATGNALITAQSDDEISSRAGAVAVGGSAGGAGSIAFNDVHSDTLADVTGIGTYVNALGDGTAAEVDNGQLLNLNGLPSSDPLAGRQLKDQMHGVAVVASSTSQVENFVVSVGGGGSAGVAGTLSVAMLTGYTSAEVTDSAVLNTSFGGTSHANQEARVAAYHHDNLASGSGGGGIGGDAGIGGAMDTLIDSHVTTAQVKDASAQAQKAVTVEAGSTTEIAQAVIGLGVGGYAGLAGSIGLILLDGTTQALADNADLNSKGSLSVQADSDISTDVAAGALAASAAAGIGLTGTAAIYGQQTRAWVMNGSQLNARAATQVEATSSLDHEAIAVTASAAGLVAFAGSANVVVVKGSTEAMLADTSSINADASYANSAQNVSLSATDTTHVDDKVGGAGLSLGGGVGAAVDVVLINNGATASVGADASVNAWGDIVISASTTRGVNSYVVALAAGGTAGISGAVSVVSIGARAGGDAQDEAGDSVGEVARTISADAFGSQMNSDAGGTSVSRDRANAARAGVHLNSEMSSAAATTVAATSAGQLSSSHGNVDVGAHNRADTFVTADAAGIGGTAGLGGGIAIANLGDKALASVTGTTHALGSLNVHALDDQSAAHQLITIAGGGGTVGLGASVSILDKSSTAEALLGGDVTAADVTVDAGILHGLDIHGGGAGVGLLGVGVALAYATESGQAHAGVLDGADITASSLDVHGHGQTDTQAEAIAAGGGLIAGAGADAESKDHSQISATLGDQVTVHTLSGLTQVRAESDPLAHANALGISVSASVSLGISEAVATVDTQTTASTGENSDITAADFSLRAETKQRAGQDTAYTKAIAGVGGALLGAGAAEADSTVVTITTASLGKLANLDISHDLKVEALSATQADSHVEGYTAGLLAGGSNLATTTTGTTTLASVGDDATLTADNLLKINAQSSDTLRADTDSGSGGLGSLVASNATTNAVAHTDASLGTATGSLGTINAKRFEMDARSATNISAKASSINASVAGYSGARAVQNVNNFTHVTLGPNVTVNAEEFVLHAENYALKPSDGYNVDSGSGGLLDAAAANSTTRINNTASVDLGADDVINVNVVDTPLLPNLLQGVLDISVLNQVDATDSVRLDSGGAIAIAKSESMLHSDHNSAEVNIGDGAKLYSDGDINLSARADVVLNAYARSKTYGLAGASEGASAASIGVDNQVNIGANAIVESDGESVNLLAGTDGSSGNRLIANADTRLWNYTALPVENDPDADASIIQHNRIDVANGSQVRAVKSVYLTASEGDHNARGYGEGTDAYRETLSAIGEFFGADTSSLKITGGSSYDSANNWNDPSSGVNVNGKVEAGIHHHQFLTLNADGQTATVSEGVTYSLEDQVLLADLLKKEIDELKAKQAKLQLAANDYKATQAQAAAAADAAAGIGGDVSVLQAQLAVIDTGVKVGFLHVNPITALSGDVRVSGRYLTGSNGTLSAPGDVRIDIVNNSTRFMTTNSLTIPDDQGGQVTFNGLSVSSTAAINARNQGGRTASNMTVLNAETSPKPVINVINANSNDSPTGSPAQLWMLDDVTNLRGIVNANSHGTLRISANVDAETINMATGGDFIKTYQPGFFHQGGDPISRMGTVPASNEANANNNYSGNASLSDVQASSQADKTGADPGCAAVACGTTIAGNNVYISAEKLNINGLIQAGLPDRGLTIDNSLFSAINPAAKALNVGTTITNLSAMTSLRQVWLGSNHSQQFLELNAPAAGSNSIKVSYDAANDRLQLDNVRMGGGHMELFGNIFSTGNGQLKVMDGYGQINVSNTTGYDLAVGRVDTGAGVEGVIKITDTSKRVTNGVLNATGTGTGGVPLVTQITRLGDTIYTYDNATSDGSLTHQVATGTGRNSSYSPTANRRFNWIEGRSTVYTTTDIYYTNGITIFTSCDGCAADSNPPPSLSVSPSSPVTRLNGDWLSANEPAAADYKFDYTRYTTPKANILDTTVRSVYDSYVTARGTAVEVTWWERWTDTHTVKDQWTVYDYYHQSLNASKSIGITFTGYDAANLNVNSVNSQLLLGGLVRAVNGSTLLNGKSGIQSLTDDAHIVANNLILTSAAGAIGSAAHPINIDLVEGGNVLGKVSASGRDGLVLKEIDGDLQVAQAMSDNGDVTLIADRNLFADSSNVVVSGNNLNLVALSGQIGDALNPLKVETQGSTSTFKASAAGDINVTEQTGDLRVVQIKSEAGDVTLSAPGSLLDKNEVETADKPSIDVLRNLWNEMALRGDGADTALDRNLAAQKNGLKQSYEQYFRMRNLHRNDNGSFSAAAYDPSYAYHATANQAAALAAANGAGFDLSAYEASQTAAYHAAYVRFGGGDYVSNYTPTLTTAETNALSAGHKWSDAQLTNAISAGLLKETADTNIRIEDPNIVGRNIALQAGASIGKDLAEVVIVKGTGFDSLSDDQKLALLIAERNDLTVSSTEIHIAQHEDINLSASGKLNATAMGNVYLGSEQNLQIDQVQSPMDVRIKTGAGVSAVAGKTNVSAANIVLEAAGGDLGSQNAPVVVAVGSGKLTARAGADLYVSEASGDMVIESVFGRGDVTLAAPGAILEAQTDRLIDIRADNIHLTAGDTIGQAGTSKSLDVAVDAQGVIDADAPNGVYLNSTGGSGKLGNVHTTGRFDFSVDQGGVDVVGVISADAGVSLSASDDLNFSGGKVQSTSDVNLTAGSDGSGSVLGNPASGPDVVSGGDLSIVAANDIGGTDSLQIQTAHLASLRASNINAELSPLISGNSLAVTVTGPIGDTTLNANLNFVDVGDVTLPSFIVHNGLVRTDGPTLSVQEGYLGDAVTFFTPYFGARIDHLVRSKTPGLDVRAFTLNNDFSLSLTPTSAHLNDLLINQNLRRNVFGSSGGVADVISAESLQTLQRQLPGQGFSPPPGTTPSDGEPLVVLDQISLADGLIPKQ
jgi:filamentous hemagglutinin family protein